MPRQAQKRRPGSSSGGAPKKTPASVISAGDESDSTRQLSPLRQPNLKVAVINDSIDTRNGRLRMENMATEGATTIGRMILGKKKLTML